MGYEEVPDRRFDSKPHHIALLWVSFYPFLFKPCHIVSFKWFMPSQTQKNTTPEKFLNRILEEAVQLYASDVHIEPLAELLRVRFRIDGSLREHYRQPLAETEQLVTRIKAISDLDIASHLPQDGHFEFTVQLGESMGDAANKLAVPSSQLAHALPSL